MATALATPQDLQGRDVARPLGRTPLGLAPAPLPGRRSPVALPGTGIVSAGTYRRRRVAALLVLLALVVFAIVVARVATVSPPMIAANDGQVVIADSVQLQPGDTLWDLAVAATPAGQDPRVMLEAIRGLNGFASDVVPVWTTVAIPGSNG